MTVAELIEDLKKCPQDAEIYAEGERADKVTIEGYDEFGHHKEGWAKVVRIHQTLNVIFECPMLEKLKEQKNEQ